MNTMNQEEEDNKISQLIAKCWADEGFKQKLLANPAATLKAAGLELPAGLSIKALENTDKLYHLIIPAKPTELSDEDLDKVAAGATEEVLAAMREFGSRPQRGKASKDHS